MAADVLHDAEQQETARFLPCDFLVHLEEKKQEIDSGLQRERGVKPNYSGNYAITKYAKSHL